MKHPRFLPCIVLALLAGCNATTPTKKLAVDTAMYQADLAIKGGQNDRAIQILGQAASDNPQDGAPLLRIAQMHYDRGNYGEAIVHATGALKREPDNLLANSIAAVSGLRVASKALADLAERNNISGPVRTEAEDLAKLLRSSLGEDVLVPRAKPRTAAARPVAKQKQVKEEDSSNPFGALK